MFCLKTWRFPIASVIFTMLLAVPLFASADLSKQLLDKYKAASTSLQDIKATMIVTNINKNNAEEMNPAFSEIGQFQKATVYYKNPDRFRLDGVIKGMNVAYVVNGTRVQTVVPGLVKRSEDVATKPGKQRTTLDMGFVTESLWKYNNVASLGREGNLVKLRLTPKREKSKRQEIIWVDPGNLRLMKRERYNGDGELRAKYSYGDYKTVGKMPIAQQAKIYAPDGGFVGTIEYKDMKLNTGVADSLFVLFK